VARLLNEMGFSLKTNRKNIESSIQHKPGHRARRNRQFLTIKSTRHRFERAQQPVISVDGKK
jgi:Rhodopirellula transposase DDE domain